ncbi:MAG: hypothetical protein IJZ35_03105 [Clostridia bacterium]|nr:hypothetical protein [Clostridia bacterium]
MNNENIMIIGGDCRFSYMKKILENRGYCVKRIYPGEYKADDFSACSLFILPVPVSRDNININAPLAGEAFYFGDFIRLLPENSTVAGGMILPEWEEKLKAKNIRVFDYYKDEILTVKNAIPTAEGVIGILINSLPETIDGMKCAVTGYGRCAKEICKKLKCMGAEVTVAARSDENLQQAADDGMKVCRLSQFCSSCADITAIINTVPARIIDEHIISNLKSDSVIIEIASAPFGTDFDCAQRYGINVVKAGSLPGRTAPETAGKIICDTILQFYRGDVNGT